jgi:hypothetical protein
MAACDPNNGNDVWLNNEWGSASNTNTDQWATETAEMSNFGPSISNLGQDFGNIQGGQTVDIYGSEFVNGGTSVYFGGYQSPSVTFVDSTHIQATSPEVPDVGAYTLSVSTADGNAMGPTYYYFDQTATGLSIGPDPSVYTQPVTWVATVYPYTTSYGVPATAPTGTVYFSGGHVGRTQGWSVDGRSDRNDLRCPLHRSDWRRIRHDRRRQIQVRFRHD